MGQVKVVADSRGHFISPQSAMTIFLITPPSCKPKDSILVTTSKPSFTCPNTTCLPSSLSRDVTSGSTARGHLKVSDRAVYHSVFVVQMKNWEPLVFGPEFAIERVPVETETG